MEVITMLKKLLFATVMCLCLAGILFAQKDNPKMDAIDAQQIIDPNETFRKEEEQKIASDNLSEAVIDLEKAREKERKADEDLKKADPNAKDFDKFLQNAASASVERSRAETLLKIRAFRAKEVGIVIEVKNNEQSRSGNIKEASLTTKPTDADKALKEKWEKEQEKRNNRPDKNQDER
jgi:hypothetical protein